MKRPLVTVVIDNHNYARYLPMAIRSVREQTYASLQLLVVDDGSTDDSREVLKALVSRTELILQDNGGQAAAFNTGVEAARGDLLCFLDADDWWSDVKVEIVVSAAMTTAAEDAALIRHSVTMHDGHQVLGHQPVTFEQGVCGPIPQRQLLTHRCNAPASALSLSRSAAERVFPLPTHGFRISADAAVYTLARLFGAAVTIPERLGYYRVHGANAYLRANDGLEKRVRTEQALISLCRERGWDPRIPGSVYRDTRRMPHLDEAGILRRPLRMRLIDCFTTAAPLPSRAWRAAAELTASLT